MKNPAIIQSFGSQIHQKGSFLLGERKSFRLMDDLFLIKTIRKCLQKSSHGQKYQVYTITSMTD